jgi:peptidoglycan/LPS O-acetylase OafA/YrhL
MSNPQPVRKQNSKLEGLEAGRGVAAMMVLLYHCALHCKNVFGQFALGQLFAFGHAGVDFFFVLSGFIIFHAHRQDFGRADRLGRYVERRVTRIYPLYWIVLAATLFVALFSHHPFPTFEHVIVSALLSPTVGGIIVVDAWTLQHEMVFYTVFALAVFNRRLGFAVFAAWFLFLIVCTQMSVKWESGLLSKLSSYFNFEFFIGMAAAWLAGRGGVAWPRVCALLGVAGFLAVGAGEDLGLWPALNIFTHAGYGVSAMLIVLGLVSWERRSGLAVPRTLARLGDASYSIYLVHVLTIGIIWQAIQRLGIADNIAPFGLFAILAAVATSVGLVVSIYAEKPLLRVLRSRRRRGLEPEVVAVG